LPAKVYALAGKNKDKNEGDIELKIIKVFTAFIALMMVLVLASSGLLFVSALQSGDFTYTVSNSKATVTAYTGAGGTITIPYTLGGYPVTNIGSSAFKNNTTLTGVTIPNSVTAIGSQAFADCTKLTNAYFIGSYPAIVSDAFTACSSDLKEYYSTLTKTDTGFKVNIRGWNAAYKYQIWSYQKITSDLLLNNTSNVPANQWIVSKAYTPGNSSDAIAEADGSISFLIDSFTSPDSNYTVAVRVIDQTNSYIGETRDSYTPAEVQEVKLTKAVVDGVYSNGSEVKKITSSSSVIIKAIGNNVANTVFSATVKETGSFIAVSNTNEFIWNTSSLAPGQYTVMLEASNGTTMDKMNIVFRLYSDKAVTNYGTISNMAVSPGTGVIDITPNFANGSFYYLIGEPGRPAIFTSTQTSGSGSQIVHAMPQYGIYQITGFVNRAGEIQTDGSFDDGIMKTVSILRSQTIPSSASLSANINLNNPVAKNTAVHFTAAAAIGGIGQTQVLYSFWRYDATGFELVKDWSSSNTLNWTPARVGVYTIEVRAKGADAGSYEAAKSVTVNVTDSVDQIAQNVSISINNADLNANAKARTPIIIKASASSTNSEELLYKFNVGDEFLGIKTIQNYSASQVCTWVPRKAGTYTISVLVKNKASFGKYDAVKSFNITVANAVYTSGVFDYLLFQGASSGTLSLGGRFSIYGSVHSNGNLTASPAYGYIMGAAEAHLTSSLNTWTCTAGSVISSATIIPMADFSSEVNQVIPATWTNTPTAASINALSTRVVFTGNTKIGAGNVTIRNGCTINGNLYVQGNLIINGGSPVCILNGGSIYATGSITFNNTFQGNGCVFSQGSITFSGSSNTITPNMPICMYSATGNITFTTASTTVYGLIYAPNGAVNVGGGATTFHGNIIGNTLAGIPANLTLYSNEIGLPFVID